MALMMRDQKTILAAGCVLALFLAAAACGGSSGGGDGKKPNEGSGDGNGSNPGSGDATPGDGSAGNGSASGSEGSGGGAEGSGGSGTETVTCEKIWEKYVASNPVGLIVGYEITSSVVGAGMTSNSKSLSTQTILQAKDELVETKHEHQVLTPTLGESTVSTSSVKKTDFLANCKPELGDRQVPADSRFEILEQRDEKIAVPAGEFDTHFIKSKVTVNIQGKDVVSHQATWSLKDREAVAAKSTTQSSATYAGVTIDTTTESVLVKLVVP